MSTSTGKEISTIKPENHPQHSKKELRFSYSTAEYDSYAKNGFIPPESYRRPDLWEQKFIMSADPDKGPVKVKINNMVRLLATDYSIDSDPKREYIYWNSDWQAKNWLGQTIWVRGHIEGQYYEQTKRLELGQIDPNTGVQQSHYVKDVPRLTYSIPFSKKKVEEIINAKHPFGADSINITDIDSVLFYGKFENTGEIMGFRCSGYTLDQFCVPEFKAFHELAARKGGPKGLRPDQEMAKEPYIK